MSPHDLYKKVYEVFDMGWLDPYRWYKIKNEAGEVIESVNVENYWMASVSHEFLDAPVAVAVVKTNKWQKGLLLFTSLKEFIAEEYGGKKLNPPILLENWIDPVAQATQSVNIFPNCQRGGLGIGYRVNIKFHTPTSYGEFNFDGPVYNPATASHDALWRALLSTIYHFVDLYDDGEMHDFVKMIKQYYP